MTLCPYAAESTIPSLGPEHLFCTHCPDLPRIPLLCDDWHCDTCEHPTCPCHQAADERRIAAHTRYWRIYCAADRQKDTRRPKTHEIVECVPV